MTREEAIKFLKLDKENRGKCFISDAIDVAIKALEQEPTTKEEAYNKGYEDGVKSVNICPHCGEYVGEDKTRAEIEQNTDTVIQADIIKLRRELNEINHKFAWDYGRK